MMSEEQVVRSGTLNAMSRSQLLDTAVQQDQHIAELETLLSVEQQRKQKIERDLMEALRENDELRAQVEALRETGLAVCRAQEACANGVDEYEALTDTARRLFDLLNAPTDDTALRRLRADAVREAVQWGADEGGLDRGEADRLWDYAKRMEVNDAESVEQWRKKKPETGATVSGAERSPRVASRSKVRISENTDYSEAEQVASEQLEARQDEGERHSSVIAMLVKLSNEAEAECDALRSQIAVLCEAYTHYRAGIITEGEMTLAAVKDLLPQAEQWKQRIKVQVQQFISAQWERALAGEAPDDALHEANIQAIADHDQRIIEEAKAELQARYDRLVAGVREIISDCKALDCEWNHKVAHHMVEETSEIADRLTALLDDAAHGGEPLVGPEQREPEG